MTKGRSEFSLGNSKEVIIIFRQPKLGPYYQPKSGPWYHETAQTGHYGLYNSWLMTLILGIIISQLKTTNPNMTSQYKTFTISLFRTNEWMRIYLNRFIFYWNNWGRSKPNKIIVVCSQVWQISSKDIQTAEI